MGMGEPGVDEPGGEALDAGDCAADGLGCASRDGDAQPPSSTKAQSMRAHIFSE